MFAVMEWTPPKKRGFFARRRARARGVDPETERRYAGGVPYTVVRVERDALDFERLAAAAGREAGRMLLPHDVILPPGCPVARLDTEPYRILLLFSGVRRLLFEASRNGGAANVRVGLYDPAGRCAAAALRLLRYTESVRVLSSRLSVYAHYSRLALEMYGTQFIIGDGAGVLDGCGMIVAPFGVGGLSFPQDGRMVFSGSQSAVSPGSAGIGDPVCTLSGGCISLPKTLEAQRPLCIDRLSFAAALHGAARAPELTGLIPHSFVRQGSVFPLKSLAGALLPLDKTDTNHYNISIVRTPERV